MGDGGNDQPQGGSLPPSRYYSAQYNEYAERRERLARLAAWMNGYEPVIIWESLGGLDYLMYVQYPSTEHDVIVFEHLLEWGRLVIWCFGCWRKDCGGCRWAEQLYRKELKTKRTLQAGDDDDKLPF